MQAAEKSVSGVLLRNYIAHHQKEVAEGRDRALRQRQQGREINWLTAITTNPPLALVLGKLFYFNEGFCWRWRDRQVVGVAIDAYERWQSAA